MVRRLKQPPIPKQFRGAAIAERETRAMDAANQRKSRAGLRRLFR